MPSKLTFNNGNNGTGTKEDPFRIPVVPYVKTKLKPLYADVEVTSTHGTMLAELFIVSFGTEKYISVGGGTKTLTGNTLKMNIPLYAREHFTEPEKIRMIPIKYSDRVHGKMERGYRELDPDHTAADGWSGNEYYAISYTEAEMVEYAKQFEPVVEVKPEPLPISIVVKKPLLTTDVDAVLSKDDVQDLEIVEMQDVIDTLQEKVELLLKALEGKVEVALSDDPAVELVPDVVIEEPVDDYVEEFVPDAVSFSMDYEWTSNNEFTISVNLDNVDALATDGFPSFQFDMDFVDGTEYVGADATGTYFDKAPQNDGTFDEQAVINGWTWAVRTNETKGKLRAGGFASSLNKITSDGTLMKLKFKMTNATVDPFEFFAYGIGIGNPMVNKINPKNPRVVVAR